MPQHTPEPVFTLSESLLSSLGARAVVHKYPKNSILLDEGDRSDSLYLVRSGRVKVFVADANGRELLLSIAGPGEYFGEIAFKRGKYQDVILPLTVLRRLDCVLAEKKVKVLETQARFKGKLDNVEPQLRAASGLAF
jgi:CRP-like cAMP-binding protein